MPKASPQTKTNPALELLHENVEEIRNSEQWKRALDVRAKLHSYSFSNAMLIALQCPDATMVAGYRKWQDLGRQVRKGEKSIAILAPMVKKEEDEETGEKVRKVIGFRAARVFDVKQTDGEEIPEPPQPQILDGHEEGAQAAYARLCEYVHGLGCTIETCSPEELPGNAHGCYELDSKRIRVRNDVPALQLLKTAIHETAHAVLHSDGVRREELHVVELEAESAAYLVARELGFDTGAYSFHYLAHWTGDTDDLIKSGDRALKAAESITQALCPVTEEVAG